MADFQLTDKQPSGKARLVVIALLVVVAAVLGFVYLKGQDLLTKAAPKVLVPVALSCTDEVTQLRAENERLKGELVGVNQLPSQPPKMTVTLKQPAVVAATKTTPKTNHDSSPKDPWLNAPVPDSVVKWLQHD